MQFILQLLTVTRYNNQLFANQSHFVCNLNSKMFDLLSCPIPKWLFNWDHLKEIMRLFSKMMLNVVKIWRHTCTINHILCVVLNSSIELNTSLYCIFDEWIFIVLLWSLKKVTQIHNLLIIIFASR